MPKTRGTKEHLFIVEIWGRSFKTSMLWPYLAYGMPCDERRSSGEGAGREQTERCEKEGGEEEEDNPVRCKAGRRNK